MAVYTVTISSAGSPDVVSLTDGSTFATLAVSAGRGPKGDGWTGVSYDGTTGRFTFTSNDGLGFVSDDIRPELTALVDDAEQSATEAEAAQTAAEAAQTAAETAEANTASLFDQFGDQYLGSKASNPTTDNDGDPLTEGDIYFNTTDNVLKFYSGTAWVAPESIATTAASEAAASAADALASEIDAESARDQSQDARDTANDHKLAAEAAATSATSTASALTGFDLAAIAETKADTAVDVFVYDTSRDSDGGAWRKRTQHTSWYNETLNTSTRGSRREFPAVAVIVAESNKLTIYDGDDPALPMWMVFNGGGSNFQIVWNNVGSALSSISFINGLMVFGASNSISDYTALYQVNFIREYVERIESTTEKRVYSKPISGRNAGFYGDSVTASIASPIVNDVAMTVLPDAPIDPATGLPVPTIAVATDGGVSVITDSGAVYDGASTNTFSKVFISQDNYLYLLETTFADDIQAYGPLGDISADGFLTEAIYWEQTINGVRLSDDIVNNAEWAGDKISAAAQGIRPALNLVYENRLAYTEGLAAYVSSTYNTGWMNGDIKGAFLSDTDDTDLVGGELVTNGTFDTDTSGWTEEAVTTSVTSGVVTVTNNGGSNGVLKQTVTTVVGQTYVIQGVGTNGTGSARIYVTGLAGWFSSESRTVVATSTSTDISLLVFGADGTSASFDNISVKLADEDRSVNNNGLIVNGTVTRTFVDEV